MARAGYKEWGRCDLTLVEFAEDTAVAGVFTRNVCCSSEVELGREQVRLGKARALVVNAGNSNAFTGYRGREAVEAIMAQVAEYLGCSTTVDPAPRVDQIDQLCALTWKNGRYTR